MRFSSTVRQLAVALLLAAVVATPLLERLAWAFEGDDATGRR